MRQLSKLRAFALVGAAALAIAACAQKSETEAEEAAPAQTETAADEASLGAGVSVIDDGRTGLLVPPDDVSALAAALARLVTDVPLRRSLAAAARAEATARYDWARCVAAHQDYYDHALAAAGAASRREVTP